MACYNFAKVFYVSKLKVGLHIFNGPRQCVTCRSKRNINLSCSFTYAFQKPHSITSINTSFFDKLVFNSKIKLGKNVTKVMQNGNHSLDDKIEKPPVLALKYLYEIHEENTNTISENIQVQTDMINLPYKRFDTVGTQSMDDDKDKTPDRDNNKESQSNIGLVENEHENLSFMSVKDNQYSKLTTKLNKGWIKDYNKYTEISLKTLKEENEEDADSDENIKYGSENPSTPSSLVPCGGCGAHLHCQDSAIPGFVPKEIFQGLNESQLQAIVCQRCHFLREYNMALSVNVDPEIYPQLLSQIKSKTALVILVVDMTDFPCSIWPGILDIIGPKRPLFIVGNKIDLLQDTSKDWLIKAKTALIKQLPPRANILDVLLVSAKTGYGIEQLITSLYNLWEYRGDVYLVGCTNVGKSTLFNTLLQSDYCKTKAVNLLQSATTAPWPGTTLNLLKFPIMRPQSWRLAMRSHRLKTENASDLKRIQEGNGQVTPQMISVINRTFAHGMTDISSDEYFDDPFAMPKLRTLRRLKAPNSGLDPNDPVFASSKWLYDTPGVITPDQIIDLLTTEELMKTLPKEPIVPRSFTVWPGQSLMIGGLARLDYIQGPNNLKMTVLSSKMLPVSICFTEDVEEVYDHYLGSEVLEVPSGSAERLKQWPGLSSTAPFVLKGEGWKQSCADVVLSSAGWIAITALENSVSQLQAWTPNARGIHVRVPPVLPRAIALKGRRLFMSQAYALFNDYAKKVFKNR